MFKGEYIDDATEEVIPEGELVELTIKHPSVTRTIHLSTSTWDDLLSDSDALSSAFFSED